MRKILSIILLAAMTVSFAACGDTPEDVVDTSEVSDTTDTTVVTDEYVAPDVDYTGETFTIAGVDLTFAYDIAEYNIISHDELSGDIISNAIINMTRSVEEELGVTLEFIDLGGAAARSKPELISRYVYADEDTIQAALPMSIGLATLLATPEVLCDLNTIDTLDLTHSWWDENSVTEYTIGDRLYSVNGDICLFRSGAPVVTFFNKELLERYDLEDPYQLVRDGEWTLDKMIEMASAASLDNGNQTVDIEDTFGMIGEPPTLAYMLQSGGVDWSKTTSDGEIEMTLFGERAASIVEKVVSFLHTKNVTMYSESWKQSGVDVYTGVLTPKFIENGALFFSNQLLMALDFRAMEADFGILPMPKYDIEQEEYITPINEWWCDNLIVPASNRNLDMTGHVLEAMGYYCSELVTPAYIETSVYGKSLRDDDSAEMIDLIYGNIYYDIAALFDWGGVTGMFDTMSKKANTNLASEYAKIESQIILEMEQTMEVLTAE